MAIDKLRKRNKKCIADSLAAASGGDGHVLTARECAGD